MRNSPSYYIHPLSISITANANGSSEDIAVYIAPGTSINVYSNGIAALSAVDGDFQTWNITGKNRRLRDNAKEYTIYARLKKDDKNDGYLVFAPKHQKGNTFSDKYPSVLIDGMATIDYAPDADVAAMINSYWFIRIGDVSLPENGRRTLTFDTGILGTDQFNTEWSFNGDELPMRVALGCTVNGEDAGPTPYVFWQQAIVLAATLMEGWSEKEEESFDHWEVTRNSGDAAADALWNRPSGTYRTLTEGAITLTHARGTNDDFNGAVAATFTVTAYGTQESEENEGEQEMVVLAKESINIMAETVEQYGLELSEGLVAYNPQTESYTPAGGITVSVRATDQKGEMFTITNSQAANAGLMLSYAIAGSDTWTALAFSGQPTAAVAVNIATSVFAQQKSVNLKLERVIQGEEEEEEDVTVTVDKTTIAFVRDGEDSKEREWIFYRSTQAVVFGDGTTQAPKLPALIDYGEVDPTGAARHITNQSNTDGWVPEGWYDEENGVDATYRYEYGSYRTYVRGANGNHWGAFTTPKLWHLFAENGMDGAGNESVFIRTAAETPPHIADDSNPISCIDSNGAGQQTDGYLPAAALTSGKVEDNNFAQSAWGDVMGTWNEIGECTAQPKGPNATWPYEWQAVRRKNAPDAQTGARTWQLYTGTMTLYGRYGKDAAVLTFSPEQIDILTDQNGTGGNNTDKSIVAKMLVNGTEATLTSFEMLAYPSGVSKQSGRSEWIIATTTTSRTIGIRLTSNSSTGWQGEVRVRMSGTVGEISYTAVGAFRILANRQGPNGQTTQFYSLKTSVQTVQYEGNAAGLRHFTPESYELALYKAEGDSQTKLTVVPTGMSLFYYANAGGEIVDAGEIDLGVLNTDTEFDGTAVNEYVDYVLYNATSADTTKEIDRVRVTAVRNYQRMLVPAGAYTERLYTRTENTTPLVLDTETNTYWFLVEDSNDIGRQSSPNYEAPAPGCRTWRQATEYEVVMTKMLFADFARLGGFVVYGNFFLAQYGTLIDAEGEETVVDETNDTVTLLGPPYTLKGNEIDAAKIVCKVTFELEEESEIAISLNASTESKYDIGAVGMLDSTAVEAATQSSIKGEQTQVLMKGSGTDKLSETVTVSAGTHFFEIIYVKDNSRSNNDDAVAFNFEGASFEIELVTRTTGTEYTLSEKVVAAYSFFDPEDPMADILPEKGYKFRPMKCINALTGEEWMAGGKVHVDHNGDMVLENVTAQNITVDKAVIKDSMMFHRVYREIPTAGYINLFEGATEEELAMKCDIFLLHGNYSSNQRIQLPPAKFFAGAQIKIINGTYNSSGGRQNSEPSVITLSVYHSSTTEEAAEDSNLVQMNSLAVSAPMELASGSMAFYDYYSELTFDTYTSIELVSALNWYAPGNSYYVWMVVDAH